MTYRPSDVFVTLLAGGRPDALCKTLANLGFGTGPSGLSHGGSLAFVHRPDLQSQDQLERCPWVDKVEAHVGSPLPIGPSTSLLAAAAVASGKPVWLHIEDDWTCARSERWLADALAALHGSGVAQLRLRDRKDGASARNALSHGKIRWKSSPGNYAVADNAHYTFNPALTLTSVAKVVFPARSELNAMENYASAPRRTGQLVPGVFYHNHAAPSMREATPGSAG